MFPLDNNYGYVFEVKPAFMVSDKLMIILFCKFIVENYNFTCINIKS